MEWGNYSSSKKDAKVAKDAKDAKDTAHNDFTILISPFFTF